MSSDTDHPRIILRTLDQKLDHDVSLVIFGRAAIWLGFQNVPRELGTTKDVDGIIPHSQLANLIDDQKFWDAVEATNQELEPQGLYITHLFQEDQIFLRASWESHLVPLPSLDLHHLRLFRPATVDFILTKMMRGADEQDLSDIELMIKADHITKSQLSDAFANMQHIELIELQDALARAKPLVLSLAFD